MACWWLRDWRDAGVWDRLHCTLLNEPGAVNRIARERARLHTASAQRQHPGQKRGDPATGAEPTNRGKPGATLHLNTDRRGTPFTARITRANRHDSEAYNQVADATQPIR